MFSTPNLIGGLLFSSIGFAALVYGKKMMLWRPMLIGTALISYPFLIYKTGNLYCIGIGLTAALFIYRE